MRRQFVQLTRERGDDLSHYHSARRQRVPGSWNCVTEPHSESRNVLQLLVIKQHGMDTDGLNIDVPRNLHR